MRAGIFLAVILALPAVAADTTQVFHDADYYHRTATEPPGQFVIGPSLHYSMQLSPGLSFGYRWNNGIQLIGSGSLLRLDAQDGSVPYTDGCTIKYADFTTGSHTTGQAWIQLLFPLKALAGSAK